MLPNDQYGRSVSLVTADGQDTYTVDDGAGNSFSVSFTEGTDIDQVYSSINAQALPAAIRPSTPLNEQYTPSEFGAMIMQQFSKFNVDRGLTSAQRFALASALGPYAVMLESGDLQGFIDVSGNVPIDGTLITTAIVTNFIAQINAYLNGN